MLMKICARCGKKNLREEKCSCQKERHKVYNEKRRDKDKNQFYHSGIWSRLVEMVKARANGLDELSLSQGKIEEGNTAHHICPIEERPDLKMELGNLIYLSAGNHNRVHKVYNSDEKTKKKLQKKLLEIVRRE